MDDTISRQTVLDAIDEISREVDDGYGFDYAKWREYFCDLPSIQFATDTNVGDKLVIDPHKIERAIRGLTEWQKHVQTESDIDRDISVAVEALKAQLGTNLAEVGTDLISRQLRDLQSEQQEKQHGRIFQEIVVEYPSISTYLEYKGKPYFSIKYTENGQGFIGYGTYSPEVLSGYLKEYFMPPAEPKIIRCRDCRYYNHEEKECLDLLGHGRRWEEDDFCSYAER